MFLVYFRLFFSSFIKLFCPGLLISTTRTFSPGVLHSQLIFYFNFNCHYLKFSGFRSCALSPNVLQDDHCWVFLAMKGFSLGLTCTLQEQNEVCKVRHLPTRTPGAMLALGFKSCPSIWLNNYLMGHCDRQEWSFFCKLKQFFPVCLKLKYSGKRDLRKDSSALLCPACPNIGIFWGTSTERDNGSVQMEVCKPAVVLGFPLAAAPKANTQERSWIKHVLPVFASAGVVTSWFLVSGCNTTRDGLTPDKGEGLHTDTWQVYIRY